MAQPSPLTAQDAAARAGVETPSGKSAQTENFPVGSFLLAPKHRPVVAAFYAFARAADDIADNPALAPDEKIARLNGFERGLDAHGAVDAGYEKAARLAAALRAAELSDRHARALLSAFRQDALKQRYASWAELVDYCTRSADPVGRFLLDLHGEDPAGYRQSDALCTALQVLNHLQDCGEDRREMDRVYVPLDWLAAHGGRIEDLDQPAASPALAKTLAVMLENTRALIAVAKGLPRALRSKTLAMESAVIVGLAERLAQRLDGADPLARRIKLSKWDFLAQGGRGVIWGLLSAGKGRG